MVHEELRLSVEVDVGPVGQVQAEALEVEQQGQLVADEVGRARSPGLGVGAIEGHGAGAVGELGPPCTVGPVVEAVAAPQVVGLPRGDAVLEHVGRHGRVVADGQRDELLLPAVADELQEVAARQPVLRDVEGQGRRPWAAHRAEPGRHDRGGLRAGREEVGLHDQATTEALVEAHPVGLHLYGAGRCVDEQRDVVTGHRAHLAGEALQRVVGLDEVADPVERPGLRVLGDQPRCRGTVTPPRRRVHDGGRPAGPRGAGPGPAGAPVVVAQAGAGQPGGAEGGQLQNCRRSIGRRSGGSAGVRAAVRGEGLHRYDLPAPPVAVGGRL